MEDFTTILSDKDVEIARHWDLLQQAESQGPGTITETKEKVDRLRAENSQLRESNASLSEKVKSLTKKLLQAHADANSCRTLLLQSSTPRPPLS
ncbi:hypothetical protein R3W88_031824 [Solanum pinnatisectum]|uniref:Uncharacterized protein n=1 Tax=Solanum pinnatisectum TaxID=50273 RepID=A0AAV9LMF2_9SOLN|nr:hypothetical protein R3W88_031824 [Solanum pinnatisectum]